jgi:hypothetical protein
MHVLAIVTSSIYNWTEICGILVAALSSTPASLYYP